MPFDFFWQVVDSEIGPNTHGKKLELLGSSLGCWYMKDITDERKAENEAYLQAKKDDEDAKALLEKAKEAFTAYYIKTL